MTIDATQTQGLTRTLTRETLNQGPQGKVELKKSEHEKSEDKTGASGESSFSLFGDDGLSFWDVLDVFNPLQHIPVVNSIYRELTGDTIKPGIKLIGGTLFGGAVGLATSAVDVAVEGFTGKDIGENAIAMAEGEGGGPTAASYIADADLEPSSPYYEEAQATLAAVEAARKAGPQAQTQAAATATATPAVEQQVAAASAQTSALPPWSPVARQSRTESENASTTTAATTGKTFALPKHRNAYADSPKPLNELRADTLARGALTSSGTVVSSAEMPAGLSENAMRAAGLTPDMVRDVIAAHATDQAKDAAATAKETDLIGSENTPAGAENMWFYSAMNQALDKYSAAKTLAPNPKIAETSAVSP